MLAYDIKDLVKRYPDQEKPANSNIALEIHQGEIFGILGDNGAGKTTLVRQMMSLLAPTSGKILLFGRSIDEDPLHVAMNVGYMPQQGSGLNNLTVDEILYFTAHLRGLSRREASIECERLLDIWGIRELHKKMGSALSGGQKQLLQLCTAMAGSPPVLILDEPTANLDPRRRKLVWDVLRQTQRTSNSTIIFITHDAIEAEKAVDRVCIMHKGQVLITGRPSQLKQSVFDKLRLELFFPPDHSPSLPQSVEHAELRPGHWLIYTDRQNSAALLSTLNMSELDDFRLYSATLEDLYLYYAN